LPFPAQPVLSALPRNATTRNEKVSKTRNPKEFHSNDAKVMLFLIRLLDR